jgi:hypothetical protein
MMPMDYSRAAASTNLIFKALPWRLLTDFGARALQAEIDAIE